MCIDIDISISGGKAGGGGEIPDLQIHLLAKILL